MQVWDADALAALLDAADFLGHAALHGALCSALAADVRACCEGAGNSGADATGAIRARLRLPADLSAAAQAAARHALTTCTALPIEVLQGGAEAGAAAAAAAPLASFRLRQSLLLVFWHLPHAAAEAATLTCAAWAYAGLEDVAGRMSVRPQRLCALFLRLRDAADKVRKK